MSDYQIRYQIIFFSIFFICIIGVIFYVLNDKFNAAVSRVISPYKLLVLGFSIPCIYMLVVEFRTYLRPHKMGEYIIHGRFHIVFVCLFIATMAYPVILNTTDRVSERIKRNYIMIVIALSLSLTIYEAIVKNYKNVAAALLLVVMAIMYFFNKSKSTSLTPEERVLQDIKHKAK